MCAQLRVALNVRPLPLLSRRADMATRQCGMAALQQTTRRQGDETTRAATRRVETAAGAEH